MLKRHSIDSFPVTAQHRVAIICLLTLTLWVLKTYPPNRS